MLERLKSSEISFDVRKELIRDYLQKLFVAREQLLVDLKFSLCPLDEFFPYGGRSMRIQSEEKPVNQLVLNFYLSTEKFDSRRDGDGFIHHRWKIILTENEINLVYSKKADWNRISEEKQKIIKSMSIKEEGHITTSCLTYRNYDRAEKKKPTEYKPDESCYLSSTEQNELLETFIREIAYSPRVISGFVDRITTPRFANNPHITFSAETAPVATTASQVETVTTTPVIPTPFSPS